MSAPDADRLLRRALAQAAAAAGVALVIAGGEAVRWASATFTGARHELTLTMGGGDDWLAALPEAELRLRGHLVADLKVVAIRRGSAGTTAVVEVLTVEEP